MAQSGLAACPRCGAKPRNGAARFCSRCGIQLPEVTRTPSWAKVEAAPSRPPPAQPPIARPPIAPPMMAPPPPQYVGQPFPPAPQTRKPPAQKSQSGCGCLLAFLIVVGILVFIGRVGTEKRNPAVELPPLSVEVRSAGFLPSRPLTPFKSWESHAESDAATIQSCSVEQVTYAGTPHYQLNAEVAPGSQRRVVLGVYFVDSFGYSVRAVAGSSNVNRDGTLSAGARITGGGDTRESGESASVSLMVPVSSARTPPASVQFSLFDENNVELARWVLPVDSRRQPYYPSR